MTALIKSGSIALEARVRPFDAGLPAVSVADAELVRLEAEVAALTEALADRAETIAAMAGEAEAAAALAREEGKAEGREEAEDQSGDAIAAIREAAEDAVEKLEESLQSTERLAALLALTCLDRMLLASAPRSAIVAELLAGQVAALRADAIVRIEVSAEDFIDAEALEAAGAGLPCRIAPSADLDSGDCRIALQLGALDVGLDQQWGTLRAELDAMIGGEARA